MPHRATADVGTQTACEVTDRGSGYNDARVNRTTADHSRNESAASSFSAIASAIVQTTSDNEAPLQSSNTGNGGETCGSSPVVDSHERKEKVKDCRSVHPTQCW